MDLLSANVLQERFYYLHDEGGEIEAQKNTVVRPALQEYEPVPFPQSLGDFLGGPLPGAEVPSLVGKLRSCMTQPKKKRKEPEAGTRALGEGGVAARSTSSQPSPACPPARSELTLSHIGVWASGEWECSVSTVQGNASKKVEIVVLETSASYCPAERVANNRGDFRFGTPLAIPCPRSQPLRRG